MLRKRDLILQDPKDIESHVDFYKSLFVGNNVIHDFDLHKKLIPKLIF